MIKANWRYGSGDAPKLLRSFDYLIQRKNGKRDWLLIFTGAIFLFFTVLSQNWGLGLLLAFCFSWLALWPVRIRQFGFRRGTRYYWKEAKNFDTAKWATPKIVIKKKQIAGVIHNSFVARWFRTWPRFFQELFWSGVLVVIGIWLFQVYKDYPNWSSNEPIDIVMREIQKIVPFPNELRNAVFMGGAFIGLGVVRFSWFMGNWFLNKINFRIKILVRF